MNARECTKNGHPGQVEPERPLLVTAFPGFFAATPFHNRQQVIEVVWQSVLGWLIELHWLPHIQDWRQNVYPVTPVPIDEGWFVIRFPDGLVTVGPDTARR